MLLKAYLRLIKIAVAAALATPILILVCSYHLHVATGAADEAFLAAMPRKLAVVGAMAAALAVVYGVFLFALRRITRWLDEVSEGQAAFLDSLRGRPLALAIVGAAAISLFLELALIRWQISIFPVLAFYKNFVLLAAFAGLGIGYAVAGKDRIPLVLTPALLGWLFVSQEALRRVAGEGRLATVMASPVSEQLNMGLSNAQTPFQFGVIYFTLAMVFLSVGLVMVPVGQLCGRTMQGAGNLKAYGYNLLGSLAGVVLMMVMSYLWTSPVIWFGLVLIPLVVFFRYHTTVLVSGALMAMAAVLVLAWPGGIETQRIYSPYQIIERETTSDGYTNIRAAGHFYQRVHNYADWYVAASPYPDDAMRSKYYELPFRIFGAPEKAVVVGAGSGNDVAAALRMGARRVDAVEIDPVIVALGRTSHPEGPYRDSRVRTVVNDARTFFRNADEKYDMIVYGLLDSHSVLNNAASLRLDSFVYTVEGFREARSCLTDDGVFSLSFFVLSPELGQKIYTMLKEAFDGREPVCLKSTRGGFFVYLQSERGDITMDPEVLSAAGFEDVSAIMGADQFTTDVSTDDWPFFYMPRRVYPFSYLGMIATVILLTLVMLGALMPGKPSRNWPVFFLLGAGFMLVETKGITELGLQFGNTWQVIGVVIAGILLMAYLANLAVQRLDVRRPAIPFLLLVVTLLAGYFMARSGGFDSTVSGRIFAVLLLTSPLFFSGIVFSTVLRSGGDIAGIMSANLFGAMCGGLLEYNAMRFGYTFLYLLAVVVYGVAALFLFRTQAQSSGR